MKEGCYMKPVVKQEKRKNKKRVLKIVPWKLHHLTYPNFVQHGKKKLQLKDESEAARFAGMTLLGVHQYFTMGVKSMMGWQALRCGLGYITPDDVCFL